jgi:hypothetical protein
MLLKSGSRELYHLEVSKEGQRIAMRNVSVLRYAMSWISLRSWCATSIGTWPTRCTKPK